VFVDPGPQPDGEMSEIECRLLEAARRDRVPDALRARMADGFAAQLGRAALHGGPAAGAPLFAKAGMWGVLTLAVLAAVAGWHATRPASRVESAAPAAPVVRASAPAAVEDGTAQVPAPAPSRSAEATDSARSRVPADEDGALRAEIALLDRARKALRDGASARALQLLDAHRERFAQARLAPEAEALRIEALVQGGSREQARLLSRQFASAYPAHPLTEHVAKLAPP
jgi:hypothetical protein